MRAIDTGTYGPSGLFEAQEQRIASFEAWASAAENLSGHPEDYLRDRRESETGPRVRRSFVVGLLLGVAVAVLASVAFLLRSSPTVLGDGSAPALLAASLAESYGDGAQVICTAHGGGFECAQPDVAGSTLQVRLDYRGCWEAKPNSSRDRVGPLAGCIGPAPRPD